MTETKSLSSGDLLLLGERMKQLGAGIAAIADELEASRCEQSEGELEERFLIPAVQQLRGAMLRVEGASAAVNDAAVEMEEIRTVTSVLYAPPWAFGIDSPLQA